MNGLVSLKRITTKIMRAEFTFLKMEYGMPSVEEADREMEESNDK